MTMEIIRSTSESLNRIMTGWLNAHGPPRGLSSSYNVQLSREEAALGLFLESAETISIHDHPDNY